MQHLGGTGELVKSGLVDGTIGGDPEGVKVAFDQVKAAVAEGALNRYLQGHTVCCGPEVCLIVFIFGMRVSRHIV